MSPSFSHLVVAGSFQLAGSAGLSDSFERRVAFNSVYIS